MNFGSTKTNSRIGPMGQTTVPKPIYHFKELKSC